MKININGKEFIPHVLELSFGVDRNIYTLMDVFYNEINNQTTLSLPSKLAPQLVNIFPLLKKPIN